MVNELARYQGWSWMKPEGAFYVFLNIGSLVQGSVAAFAARALEEKGVCVIPGEAFGMPDYIRLSYALGEDDIREGVARLSSMLF